MSSYISLLKNIDWYNIIGITNNNDKNNDSQVLDPLSCLIRLALLNYKPKGTKLSFNNNKIIFQEPDMFQSARRWSQGDNRQHIHNLYNPIFKVSSWYDTKRDDLVYILKTGKKGLENLLSCYNKEESNIITHSINYYIETIDNILKDEIKPEDLSATTDVYSLKLRDLWNDREINIVYLILLDIEERFNTEKAPINDIDSLMLSIEEILKGKDKVVNKIVNKISTSL